jgi:penicillin G amidase
MRNWGAPAENQVYADTKGNIAWVPGGFAPKRNRPDYDGLLPVPGDGRYEWNGSYSGDDLPRVLNPTTGYIATNNQYDLPPGYPALQRKLGFEWTDPYRHNRTDELLAADNKVSVQDSEKIQTDQLSIPARQITALLKPLHSNDPDISKALTLLRGWNHVESVNSAPAALFEVWLSQHLGHDFLAKVAPKAAETIGRPDTQVMIDNLWHPEKLFGAYAIASRNALLTSSLGEAWQTTTKLLGDNPAAWQWGNLQKSVFEHAMDPILSDAEKAKFNVGRLRRGGSTDTVNGSEYDPSTFEEINGASFRMVLDVGNWDASTAVNTPGQSGNQSDPHYRDLAPLWEHGKYFPLVYSKAAVLRSAERVITLLPR